MGDHDGTYVKKHEVRASFPHIPSGKRLHSYGKSPCLMGMSTISMAIFNSYVKLPKGKHHKQVIFDGLEESNS